MHDRFGRFPKELSDFTNVLKIKHVVKKLGVEKIQVFADRLVLSWGEPGYSGDPTKLVNWIQKNANLAQPRSSTRLEITAADAAPDALQNLREIVESLNAECQS